jgi:TolA-binding protein
MSKAIRITLLFVVLAVGFVSTASTQGTGARIVQASEGKSQTSSLCPIIHCIPEKVLDPKTCRCVPRP